MSIFNFRIESERRTTCTVVKTIVKPSHVHTHLPFPLSFTSWPAVSTAYDVTDRQFAHNARLISDEQLIQLHRFYRMLLRISLTQRSV